MDSFLSKAVIIMGSTVAAAVLLGCSSTPNGDKGTEGTTAFYVHVQASRDGVGIETNNVLAGKAPLVLRLMGDKGGTFHNFGDSQYVVRAVPDSKNSPVAMQVFKTGNKSSPGDRIPGLIFLDIDNPSGSFSVDTFPDK